MALEAWQRVAGVRFVEVADDGAAFNSMTRSGDLRLGAHWIDGGGNTLGHSYFPPLNGYTAAGDIHLDAGESWNVQTNASMYDRRFGTYALAQVMAHEIGHAIGLQHEPSSSHVALMNVFYNPNFYGPLADDIAGMQLLYGPPCECTVEGPCCDGCHFRAMGTVCRAESGVCDLAEHCTGSSGECPAEDERAPAGVVCRSARDVCEFDAVCDGVNATCPVTNPLKSPGTLCRISDGGACDQDDYCDGEYAGCFDSKVTRNTTCRAAAGVCDAEEMCDGRSSQCPPDVKHGPERLCRAAMGVCDQPERCDSVRNECPEDRLVGAGVVCRASAGPCDEAEMCTGRNISCPANRYLPASIVCRPSRGPCDPEEACTGGTYLCPMDYYHSNPRSCVQCGQRGNCLPNGSCSTASLC